MTFVQIAPIIQKKATLERRMKMAKFPRISIVKRTEVWKTYYDNANYAKCVCCGINIITCENMLLCSQNGNDISVCKACWEYINDNCTDEYDFFEHAKKSYPATSLCNVNNTEAKLESVACEKPEQLKIFTGDNELLVTYIFNLVKYDMPKNCKYSLICHHMKIFEYIQILLANKYTNSKNIYELGDYFSSQRNYCDYSISKIEQNKQCKPSKQNKESNGTILNEEFYKNYLTVKAIELYEKSYELDSTIDVYKLAILLQNSGLDDKAHAYFCKVLENSSKYDNEHLSIIHYNIGKILTNKSDKTNAIIHYKSALAYNPTENVDEIIQYVIHNDDKQNIRSFYKDLTNKSYCNILPNIVDMLIKIDDIDESIDIVKNTHSQLNSIILDNIYKKFMTYYTKNRTYITQKEIEFILLCFGVRAIKKYDSFLLKFAIMNRMEVYNLNNVNFYKKDTECSICCKTKSYNISCCNTHKTKQMKSKKIDNDLKKPSIICGFTFCIDCYENIAKKKPQNNDSDSDSGYETQKKCPQCREKI